MEVYAFQDHSNRFYIRIGGYTMWTKHSKVEIVLEPPRMRRCFKEADEFHRIADAFLERAQKYGGDPIAISLIKEFYNMAKIVVVDTKEKKVHALVGTKKKAEETLAAAGEGHSFVVCNNKEEFEKLAEGVRLAIAKTDKDAATMPKEEQLSRAYEIATRKEEVAAKPAKAKGVKSLIRELYAVPGASHSVEAIMALTGGTKVSVTTAISDLRSATYCKPGEPLSLTRVGDKYSLISKEDAVKMKADEDAAKAKAVEEKKAKAAADKAAKAVETAKAKEAKSAEKAAA